MPYNKSESYNEQQRKASLKAEAVTPSLSKMKKRPASLNNINKNLNDEW